MRPRSSHTPHRPPAGGPSVGRAPCPASLPRKPAAGPVCPRTGRPTRARAATGYPEETRILSRAAAGRGPVRLELIQAIQRYVQPGPALVLYDGHLERPALRSHRDRLDPAVDPDAVLEMHHVIAGLERPRRGRGRGFAIPARPPQPAGPTEDLVVEIGRA